MKTIRVACDTKDCLPLEDLTPFQGELKSLSQEDFKKLKTSILETGFAFPISVWKSPEGVNFIIGGHQRVRTLRELRDAEGYLIPPVPVVFIEAESMTQAKRRVLQDVAQYGKIENQGLYEFMGDAGISIQDLDLNFSLPEIDISTFGDEFFKEPLTAGDGSSENAYTKKIDAPVYSAKGEKPAMEELYSRERLEYLLKEIDQADIPEEEKEFLRFAAHRHVVFNYERIAEFYAHASKKTQLLMENSALVIIDFDKAIENGFVQLSERLAEVFQND